MKEYYVYIRILLFHCMCYLYRTFLWTSTIYLPLVQITWIVGYVFALNDIDSNGLAWAFAILSVLQVCTYQVNTHFT